MKIKRNIFYCFTILISQRYNTNSQQFLQKRIHIKVWSVANNIHLNRKAWVAIKLEDTKKSNQKPEIEDRQTTEYPIEKGQKEKQRSTK